MSLNNEKEHLTQVNDNNGSLNESVASSSVPELLDFSPLSSEEVYQLAREFIKSKGGTKAVQISYGDRNMMNVLAKIVNNYKLEDERNKVGMLDLVGKDRLQLWKSLGDISREEAMTQYIRLVVKICPLFQAHFEAHKRHLEEQELKSRQTFDDENERAQREMAEQKEKKLREEDLRLLEENKKKREELQRKQIQEALNQQTYPHFKAYAEQQHPNNPQTQEELIKHLQEQHFEQYMNQVYQQQLIHQQQQAEQLRAMKRAQKRQEQSNNQQQLTHPDLDEQFRGLKLNNTSEFGSASSKTTTTSAFTHSNSSIQSGVVNESGGNLKLVTERETLTKPMAPPAAPGHHSDSNGAVVVQVENNGASTNVADDVNDDEEQEEMPPISAAQLITRKDIKEFKESVRRDNDAIIKVGSGETVTVRVPTHDEGRLIFWEFATDYYDIGFGLYFEWTISPSTNVTVHVSDSSEEDEGEEEEGAEGAAAAGGASGGASKPLDIEKGSKSNENKPPVDEIIPIFRRDSHEEVYAGSHLYPGRGVYLLKFDNSYSLWRSKTLYYRVYYSK